MRVVSSTLSTVSLLIAATGGGSSTALAQGPGTPAVEGRITSLDPRFNRLIARDAKLELVVRATIGLRGQLWDPSTRCLLYSDISTQCDLSLV